MATEEEYVDISDTGSITDSPPSIPGDGIAQQPDPVPEQTHSKHDWTDGTPTTQYADMDSDSRALIEQMLAEEEYYYGQNTMNTMKRPKKGTVKRKGATKKSKLDNGDHDDDLGSSISSVALPSHKTRWSSEEDALLTEAIDKFTYGNWKLISDHVKTRNPLQCKNRARHWAVYGKADKSPFASKPTEPMIVEKTPSHTKSPSPPQQPSPSISPKVETNTNIDTTTDKGASLQVESNERRSVDKADSDDDNISVEGDIIDTPMVPADVATTTELVEDETQQQQIVTDGTGTHIKIEQPVESTHSLTALTATTEPEPAQQEDDDDDDNELGSNTKPSPISTMRLTDEENDRIMNSFEPFTITDDEKRSNPEWFNNKQSKTPDRYLKIRNHMLNCWRSCRPRYLTKTGSRKALKDCGDVNAIGRVHAYLESIGAINVNCTKSAPRPPRISHTTSRDDDDDDDDNDAENDDPMYSTSGLLIGYVGSRKRKVRNEVGEWVDPKDLEGRVIEHGQSKEQAAPRPKRIIKRSQHYYGGDDFGRGYDPFRLVPVQYYDEHYSAPFTVEITSNSLLVMDFHSHLAHTEIIGLLGGTYETDPDNGKKRLVVKSVFPCKSTSTGIQCEMDPESEMKARDVFAAKGFIVVGWYHSHPTFEPHPSIRDIENQTSYQTLFRHDKTGDEPFIGVIVTPYDLTVASDRSQIQYLHISNKWNESHSFRVPYACRKMVNHDHEVPAIVMDQLVELVDEFKDYEHKMNMLSTFGTRSRLGKLLNSLKSYLLMETDRVDVFLESVRSLMLDTFVDDEDERTQTGLLSNEPAASVEPTAHLSDRIPSPTSQ
ncbi:hypothetical protein [Absidia glauca]|uniref:Uncharacterized protein n=1 Tax=Absidia glauca TaxID=4829 RepID=A0A168LEA8_ABSGL|nr:hypothetical protein [Absidia glauca]